ncbi:MULTISPECIES: hypothetical protein [unclassified Tolypothrix]|uniref:hypothetical protein n=1 Tax=unclassified Tolypothrix TaxID=2649714 RepID=UPI0005EAADC0|nr:MULTISPECIES: hypothetical protein [unclassified Tolypothrix]BAY95976.1 hypothetical protein NIES3275_80530 [Microchaete diplosiphon NIES-3275]EKE96781.1 hypothetical protein FDUTEX481_06323 [Tolypothrix sp. PCC 7601]MBE9084934.1 hypothetical protein [Tolypothrix sp. LEGE 11397]UYD31141.1 hypothetical protein HGR01_40545 [Tolypothrix sp. PCC 7712]UYD38937.1 hypothetical protein HG267_41335 [Tolypothrix sp. PCC 7601]
MDFRPIKNSSAVHSKAIDSRAKDWGDVEADILHYLGDVSRLEEFANRANGAEQLAQYVEPFLANAQKYLESLAKVNQGQVTWTDLRKQFSSKVAQGIAKIRQVNAQFDSEMAVLDARDRAAITKIEQKRRNTLTEIASDLNQDLQIEFYRHTKQLQTIESKQATYETRQSIQSNLQQQRKQLLERIRYGSFTQQSEQIPVEVATNQPKSNWSAFGGIWEAIRNR